MRFHMEHQFNWPTEKIVEILKSGQYLVPMDKMPNVNEYREVSVERKGSKIFKKCEWCVHGKIPKMAQKVIRPEMLTFIENTVWDDETTTFTTKIIPHFFKNQFDCRTQSKWGSAGEGKTVRKFQGNIIIKFPLIGPPVEKAIIQQLKANNDRNAVLVREALAERLGPPTE